jgi:hypothetical protein
MSTSLGPNLFGQLDPPELWLHISPLVDMRDDSRTVTLRVKARGERSMSARLSVSRYAPEATIFRAVGEAINTLEAAQAPFTKLQLQATINAAALAWVDPF